jgi:hypothetical protein
MRGEICPPAGVSGGVANHDRGVFLADRMDKTIDHPTSFGSELQAFLKNVTTKCRPFVHEKSISKHACQNALDVLDFPLGDERSFSRISNVRAARIFR